MGCHARPTRGSILPSMRSRKQTERRQLLMESSLAYPRGKERKSKNIRGGKTRKESRHLGVVKPVTPGEDMPLRGPTCSKEIERTLSHCTFSMWKKLWTVRQEQPDRFRQCFSIESLWRIDMSSKIACPPSTSIFERNRKNT
ncbi:hypothetical protein AVEN_57118-1 [Araneus ventricosus]|uniref:Uncharacterized protein n=1 Tax=Araneus ventricosus TaxID=182803 RepID=A0A4Y2H9J0_ARAVE|nr:hypothetical protein AVEN_57118-1 [Araneus ventricosus]